MTTHLNPAIAQKLHDFRDRRRRFILLRGLCAAVVSLLGVFALAAMIDWLFVLSDGARWALSIGGYITVAAVTWITCLRLMVHIPNDCELASLIESSDQTFHEDLLSAVELSDDEKHRYDSPIFRKLLQDSVADRISGVQVERMLPWRLIVGWIIAAGVVFVGSLTLMVMPGSPYAKLVWRAAVPMSNVDRVSNVQVRIVKPSPADRMVPSGDRVPVLIDVIGDIDLATLETYEGERRRDIEMTRSVENPNQYTAELRPGETALKYRVLAGDAVTAYHTITTRPRPNVVMFEKTYRYPEYTGAESSVSRDPDGHLTAVEQTQVDLVIETDQPIANGELRLTTDDEKSIPLTVDSPTRAHATVPIDMSGEYSVYIVGADTGFVNDPSPQYEINAQPDLVPTVVMTEPGDEAMVAPRDVVAVRGRAEDEFGLRRIEQWVKVNEHKWAKLSSTTPTGAQVDIDQPWDLMDLNLSNGDVVLTKLVAVDLKGLSAESAPLKLSVAGTGIPADRQRALEAQRTVYQGLRSLHDRLAPMEKEFDEMADRYRAAPVDSRQRDVYRASMDQLTGQWLSEIDRTIEQVRAAEGAVAAGGDAQNMRTIGESLARVRAVMGREMIVEQREAAAEADPERQKKLFAKPRSTMDRARGLIRDLRSRDKRVLTAELADVADEGMRVAASDRHRMDVQHDIIAKGPGGDLRIERRRTAIAQQLASVTDLLAEAHELDAGRLTDRAKQLLEKMVDKDKNKDDKAADVAPKLDDRAEAALAEVNKQPPYRSPWLPLTIDKATASSGATLSVEPDGSIKVHDAERTSDEYRLSVRSDQPRISAIRLDTLPASTHDRGGAGLAGDGTFALHEMQIQRNGKTMRVDKVRLARASDDGRVDRAGDNNEGSDWRYDCDVTRLRSAVFTLAEPIIDPAGASFDIVFKFRRGDGYGLGHFNLQAAADAPVDIADASIAVTRFSVDTAKDRQDTRRELGRETYNAARALDDLVSKINRYQSLLKKADKQDNDDKRRKYLEDIDEMKPGLFDVAWPAAVDQLQATATLESARPDADHRYAADLGLAARGVDHLKRAYLAVEPGADQLALNVTESLRERIDKPLATLTAVHNLAEAASTVTRLAAREKWQSHTPAAHTLHPRQWDFALDRMIDAVDSLRETKVDPAIVNELIDIIGSPDAAAVHSEMAYRPSVRSPLDVHEPLQRLAERLNQLLKRAQVAVKPARRTLASASPTIAQMLRKASKDSLTLSGDANRLGETVRALAVEEARPAVVALSSQLGAVERQIAVADAAIRQHVATLDPLSAEDREQMRTIDTMRPLIFDRAHRARVEHDRAVDEAPSESVVARLNDAAAGDKALAEELARAADFFDRRDKNQSASDLVDQYREAESELGIAQELDERYKKLEALAELAEKQAEEQAEMLAELAQQDTDVAQQVRDIAEQAATKGVEDLRALAQRERDMAEAIRQAQPPDSAATDPAREKIAELQKKASELVNRDLPQAIDKANKANDHELADKLNESRAALDQAVHAPQDPNNPLNQARQLADAAARAEQAIDAAAERAETTQQQAAMDQATAAKEAAKRAAEAADMAASAADTARSKAAETDQAAKVDEAADIATAAAEAAKAAAAEADRAAQGVERAVAMNDAANNLDQAADLAAKESADTAEVAAAAKQAAEAARRAAESAKRSADKAKADNSPQAEAAAELARKADTAANQAAAAAESAQRAAEKAPTESAAERRMRQALADARRAAAEAQQAAAAEPEPAEAHQSPADQAQQAADLAAAAQRAAEMANQAAEAAAAQNKPKAPEAQQAAAEATRAADAAAHHADQAQQALQDWADKAPNPWEIHNVSKSAEKLAEKSAELADNANRAAAAVAHNQPAQAPEAQAAADRATRAAEAAQAQAADAQEAAAQAQTARSPDKAAAIADQATRAADAAQRAAEQAQQLADKAKAAESPQADNLRKQADEARKSAEAAQKNAAESRQAAAKAAEPDQNAIDQAADTANAARQADEAVRYARRAAELAKQAAESSAPDADQPVDNNMQAERDATADAANKADAAADNAQQSIDAMNQQVQQAAAEAADKLDAAAASAQQAREAAEQAAQVASRDGRSHRPANETRQAANETRQATEEARRNADKITEQQPDAAVAERHAADAAESAQQAVEKANQAMQLAEAAPPEEQLAQMNQAAEQAADAAQAAAESAKPQPGAMAAEQAAAEAAENAAAAQQAAAAAEQLAPSSDNPAVAENAQQARRAAERATQSAESAREAAEVAAQKSPRGDQARQAADQARDLAAAAEQAAEKATAAAADKAASPEAQRSAQAAQQAAAEARQSADAAQQLAKQTSTPDAVANRRAAEQAVNEAAEAAAHAADAAAAAKQAAEQSPWNDPSQEARKQAERTADSAKRLAESTDRMQRESAEAAEQAELAAAESADAALDAAQATAQAAAEAQAGADKSAPRQQVAQMTRQAADNANQAADAASEAAKLAGAKDESEPARIAAQQAAERADAPMQVPQAAARANELARAAKQAADAANKAADTAKANQAPAAEVAQRAAQQAAAAAEQAQDAADRAQAAPPNDTDAANAAMQQAAESAGQAIAAAEQALDAAADDPATPATPEAGLAAANQAAANAEDAARAAMTAAQAAQNANNQTPGNPAAQQANQAAGEAGQAHQQAKAAADKSKPAAEAAQAVDQTRPEVAQLARDAQQVADELSRMQQPAGLATTLARAAQPDIQQGVREAAAELAKASELLNHIAQPERAQALQQAAEQAAAAAEKQVPAAEQMLAQTSDPAAASQSVDQAADAIDSSTADLDGPPFSAPPSAEQLAAADNTAPQSASPLAQGQLSPQAAAELARALADAQSASQSMQNAAAQQSQSSQTQSSQSQQSQSQSQSASRSAAQAAAMAALAQAARAEADAMAVQRNAPVPFGQGSPSDDGPLQLGGPSGPLDPETATPRPGDERWNANLPPSVARDLFEGRRESVDGVYRAYVESYFRAIAEQARAQESESQ
ncbi:hypothetical protein HED60_00020 [Planctomycetales bacterium ZRK34]|nr:hypothetical protein HED60_00020 [Planctomycetales bacterium ZRK34]